MDYLVLFSIGFIAAITPGPDVFYVLRQGLCKSFSAALWASGGILTGNIIYLSLVGFGLGVIGKSLYFQAIVGFFGSLYLFKIAYLIFNDKPKIENSCDKLEGFEIFRQGLLLNLSNPKAMLFFAVVVTPFLSKSIFLSLFVLFIAIASAFIFVGFISSKIKITEKMLNFINKASSILFFGFGISLLVGAYKAFIQIIG